MNILCLAGYTIEVLLLFWGGVVSLRDGGDAVVRSTPGGCTSLYSGGCSSHMYKVSLKG